MKLFAKVLVVATLAAVSGCAGGPTEGQLAYDPYESTNREIHDWNKGLDQVLVRPAAYVYEEATPGLLKFLVHNALNTLKLPKIFANNLLQGDFEEALATFGRFGVNTLMGAGGLLDPATEIGLPLNDTDFGVTLAKWGAEEGPYLEVPLIGPHTSRAFAGRIVDIAFSPLTYLDVPFEASAGIRATDVVDTRYRNKQVIDDLLYNSEDSYVAVRTGYLQNRRREVSGETDVEQLPDIFSQ